jgi:hypothetical protein
MALEAEYLYFDFKYGIGEYEKELPMCIFSTGYNLSTINRYQKYFQSIERLNYSNYRVIVVDDNSMDGTVEALY